tara:strand:- start:4430 stop:5134 length:705 start_codon:yes stop_codon:yes gene_type:complete
MFNANGFSPFRGEINCFIISVAHFKGYTPKKERQKPNAVVVEQCTEYKSVKNDQTTPTKTQELKKQDNFTPPKINIIKPKRKDGISSLSLSSIELKKEVERKSSSKKTVINESVNSFNQEKLSQLWKTYTQEKNNLGENNIAALLEMSQPKLLENHKILLKTSSELSKVELAKELTPITAYLNKSLNNFKITFEINVETRKSEEYVYGIREKYKYLKKINPVIEVLKKEFDLDL